MGTREDLPMFILDVLRHDDIEPLSSIVKMLNDDSGCIGWRDVWPHDFTEQEIIPPLQRLLGEALVKAIRENQQTYELEDISPADVRFREDEGILWFRLTKKGIEAWEKWEPPTSAKAAKAR